MSGFGEDRTQLAHQLDNAATERVRKLVATARNGDRAAFGQLVLLHQDRLYNATFRLVSDRHEAQDIVQEAFLKALEHLPGFSGKSSFYTWLFRIAYNVAVSRNRKQQVRGQVSLESTLGLAGDNQAASLISRMAAAVEAPSAASLRAEQAQLVQGALARLEFDHRTVLVLRDIDGLDYLQISEVLDLPVGTVKSRINRARAALRVELKGLLDV